MIGKLKQYKIIKEGSTLLMIKIEKKEEKIIIYN